MRDTICPLRPALACAAITLCLSATAGQADDFTDAMAKFHTDHVVTWASDPVLVTAILDHNAATGLLEQAQIDSLDQAWQAEIGARTTPTIDPILLNGTSDHLRDIVAASNGAVTEMFIMDANGLNVATSDITSDYWQGDEAKFTETYGAGPGAVHLSEVEFDESSQSYQAQISVPLVDDTGAVIGALTVGVNAETLM